MAMTFKEAWNAKPDGKKTREELFESIVAGVKERAGGKLSDVEAHTAARNLVAFCRELAGLGQEETTGNIDSIVQPAITDGEHDECSGA